MEADKIRERLDAIAKRMTDKAFVYASADLTLSSHNSAARVWLNWEKATRQDDGYKCFSGTIEKALSDAEAHVASLPSSEEARMTAFMSALSEAVALGKKNDIDVEFVNPLLALMKKLSKNALQDKSALGCGRVG